jgi:hypothetical protein
MTIWEWPSDWYRFTSGRCNLRSRSQSSASPWTGRRNVYGPHAQMWVIEVVMAEMEDPMALAVEAFLERLGGTSGLIRMSSPIVREPQWNLERIGTIGPWSDNTFFADGSGFVGGLIGPYAVVTEAESIGATSVAIGGDLPASTARVLRRGDLIEFRRDGVADATPSLHRIMVDADTDSGSETRVEFMPPLRKGVAADDMVVLVNPTSVFRLADDEQGAAEYTPPIRAAIGFSLVENLL